MPAPSDAFANLEDLLLRGGIAPRHVKRYLRELAEHLADLTAAQAQAGFDAADAAARARAALGPDRELADAMLKQRDFRSLTARFPWLVFGLMPPFALLLGFVIWMIATVGLGVGSGAIVPDHYTNGPPVPAWYDWTASILVSTANLLIPLLLGFLVAWMAQRQRMQPLWPLLGMALILLLSVHGSFRVETRGIFIGLATILPFKSPLGPGGTIHWPTFLGQAAMLGLPAAWLLRARRKIGAQP